ncbi:hypothetical protein OG216_45600 [Streptomycetaceae bacterium NBC_01309]
MNSSQRIATIAVGLACAAMAASATPATAAPTDSETSKALVATGPETRQIVHYFQQATTPNFR